MSVPENLKNLIFDMPIIPQTLNINNLKIARTKCINHNTIRKLIYYSFKNLLESRCLVLGLLRYCCSHVGWYYDLPSGVEGAKGLRN